MIIDVHTHHMPRSFLERALSDPARFQANVTKHGDENYQMRPDFWSTATFAESYHFEPIHYDWALRVASMDQMGIDKQIVSIGQSLNYSWAEVDVALEVARLGNDELAAGMKEFPERLFGIAAIPLQDPVAAGEELTRAVKDLGLKGVQLLSNIEGRNLDEAGLDLLYGHIEDLGVPIFIHPYGALNHQRMTPHFLANVVGFPAEQAMAGASLIFGGVLDRYPGLRIFLGHGGGAFPYLLGRIERGTVAMPALMNCKEPVRDYLDSFFVDTLIHDDEAMTYILKTLGADHVMLGTDWPYWMQDPHAIERVERVTSALGLDAAAVFGNNAVRLFDLADSPSV
jgi:aminocarboxymuconate-semialdehyde decarboxylase